jgi:septum formation protein
MNKHELILGSSSPYRRQLLERLQYPFTVANPDCDETPLLDETAMVTAQRLAKTKALALADRYPHAVIIAGDQVALLSGQQIGKPKDIEHAVQLLLSMSGETVLFYSALAVLNAQTGRMQEAMVPTKVVFRDLTEAKIRRYLALEPDALNCAGAAKSECLGGLLIESIESTDPNALIGLPLFTLIGFLEKEGFDFLVAADL